VATGSLLVWQRASTVAAASSSKKLVTHVMAIRWRPAPSSCSPRLSACWVRHHLGDTMSPAGVDQAGKLKPEDFLLPSRRHARCAWPQQLHLFQAQSHCTSTFVNATTWIPAYQ
jgi:hypothetical protein